MSFVKIISIKLKKGIDNKPLWKYTHDKIFGNNRTWVRIWGMLKKYKADAINFKLDVDLLKNLDIICYNLYRSRSEVVRYMVAEAVNGILDADDVGMKMRELELSLPKYERKNKNRLIEEIKAF